MYTIFREDIYIPFYKIGLLVLSLAYVFFLLQNILTPAYYFNSFFTNPSFFIIVKSLSIYLVFICFFLLLFSSIIYAYIEVGRYKQQLAYLKEDRKMYEVRLSNVSGSVESLSSMEAIFETITYSGGEGTWFENWFYGKKRPIYSFEVLSRGGIVSFLINMRGFLSEGVLSSIYSFYPNAQITEVNDYTYDIEYDEDKYSLFGFEWALKNENAIPIKSYIEFQLDGKKVKSVGDLATSQELLLIDPLAQMYDLFGSIRGNEQMWIQYVFRYQKSKGSKNHSDRTENVLDSKWWEKKKLPEEINDALIALEEKIMKAKKNEMPPSLSPAEKRLQQIGSRLIEKIPLEVGIRMIYIAEKDNFNPARIIPMTSIFKLTNTSDNALKPFGKLFTKTYSIPPFESKDLKKKKGKEKYNLIQLYRDRLYWIPPNIKGDSVYSALTSETFATICHFPTINIKTPSVRRVLSTEVEPPDNLPV